MALFDSPTSSLLKVALIILDVLFALVGSMFGLLLSRNLRGGLLQKPIQIIALAPLIIVVSELFDLLEYLTGSAVFHEFFELLFLAVLFLGFFMLYRTVKSLGHSLGGN